jgi:transcription elongation GreA/GreB family factor
LSNLLLRKARHPSARPSPSAEWDGREQSFRIVGEDEADPARGTVSYVSPLARAVLTHGPGETVEMTGGEAVILDVREGGPV